ncbi:hypothetical protein WS78_17935 [Burkholderia savannae]|nr:hypothetical protein WS78_17935 [Burkholderia savannae]
MRERGRAPGRHARERERVRVRVRVRREGMMSTGGVLVRMRVAAMLAAASPLRRFAASPLRRFATSPSIATLRQRLSAADKPPKVARLTCMRTRLAALNAMIGANALRDALLRSA